MNNATFDFYYDEKLFEGKDASNTLLGQVPELEQFELSLPVPTDVEPEIAPMCVYSLMTKEQELHLFRKMNYLKYLGFCASGNERDDRLAHAMSVRNVILKHSTLLMYQIVKAYKKYTAHTTSELFSEANLWMMTEIIDGFDFRLGVPFGAFVSQCVRKRLWTYLSRSSVGRRKMVTGNNEALTEVTDYRSENKDSCIVDEFTNLRDFIWDHIDDDKTRDILLRRLGINNGFSQSFQEIAAAYGLKYQTIQEQFNTAMVKLFGHTVSGNTIRTIQRKNR
jgi:RNA polymerase primary sigma factor